MRTVTVEQDLFDHNDWGNAKILALCDGLTDEQLDRPREMGFGSLRNTLFHLLEAERIWLERWLGQPWRPLEVDAAGMPLAKLTEALGEVAAARNELLAREAASGFARTVDFQDSRQTAWSFQIGDLLNHVSNHGIHHRAQALNFLRGFERSIAAGVDYLFWKMAQPSCELPSESLEPLRAYGLEAATRPGATPEFDKNRITRYFQYNDWAMSQVLEAARPLDDSRLDQPFEMGMASLRKSIQHMLDAERWWLANWAVDNSPFPRDEAPRSLPAMNEQFAQVSGQRNAFVDALDGDDATRVVHVTAGGPKTCFRVTESLLQLCSHGTHHRAQCLNMLRQLGVKPPAIDLIVWLRAG